MADYAHHGLSKRGTTRSLFSNLEPGIFGSIDRARGKPRSRPTPKPGKTALGTRLARGLTVKKLFRLDRTIHLVLVRNSRKFLSNGLPSLYYEEYKSRNRHNVESVFSKVYYFSAGQTSLLQVQWEVYFGTCFYVAYYRKYVKLIDSVN